MSISSYKIFPVGDQATTLSLGKLTDDNYRKILAIQTWLQAQSIPGIVDVVVAYTSITVIYDVFRMLQSITGPCHEFVTSRLVAAVENATANMPFPTRRLHIPVCYDPTVAADFEHVCVLKNISPDELVAIHSGKTYQVYAIGFLPGFAYMAEVDDRIQVPRKRRPTSKVAAGSVGIAGIQTGIYPIQSPGGWHIIGRTPLTLFDAQRNPPVLFEAGDEVRFEPISKTEFDNFNIPS